MQRKPPVPSALFNRPHCCMCCTPIPPNSSTTTYFGTSLHAYGTTSPSLPSPKVAPRLLSVAHGHHPQSYNADTEKLAVRCPP